ncbi:unnamed protein product [Clavelina lepadiformis]|uniref:Uncharacterized protein n=1 Tax=Clavelina lepadiformis TaxID=159417 RepID=A0ABP0FCR4_CLALP
MKWSKCCLIIYVLYITLMICIGQSRSETTLRPSLTTVPVVTTDSLPLDSSMEMSTLLPTENTMSTPSPTHTSVPASIAAVMHPSTPMVSYAMKHHATASTKILASHEEGSSASEASSGMGELTTEIFEGSGLPTSSAPMFSTETIADHFNTTYDFFDGSGSGSTTPVETKTTTKTDVFNPTFTDHTETTTSVEGSGMEVSKNTFTSFPTETTTESIVFNQTVNTTLSASTSNESTFKPTTTTSFYDGRLTTSSELMNTNVTMTTLGMFSGSGDMDIATETNTTGLFTQTSGSVNLASTTMETVPTSTTPNLANISTALMIPNISSSTALTNVTSVPNTLFTGTISVPVAAANTTAPAIVPTAIIATTPSMITPLLMNTTSSNVTSPIVTMPATVTVTTAVNTTSTSASLMTPSMSSSTVTAMSQTSSVMIANATTASTATMLVANTTMNAEISSLPLTSASLTTVPIPASVPVNTSLSVLNTTTVSSSITATSMVNTTVSTVSMSSTMTTLGTTTVAVVNSSAAATSSTINTTADGTSAIPTMVPPATASTLATTVTLLPTSGNISTTATVLPTFSVAPVNVVLIIENIAGNATINASMELSLGISFVEFFAEVFHPGTSRRKRSNSYNITVDETLYNVTVCNIMPTSNGLTADIFLALTRGGITSVQTPAFIRGLLLSGNQVLLTALQRNNVSASAVLSSISGPCNSTSEYIKIDLQAFFFPTVTTSFIGTSEFSERLQQGLELALMDGERSLDTCQGSSDTDANVLEICEIEPDAFCNFTVRFVPLFPSISVSSFSQDPQIYAIYLNNAGTTLSSLNRVYVRQAPCLNNDVNCGRNIDTCVSTDIPVWVVPVVVVLAVLLALCLAILIFLIWYFCCGHAKAAYEVSAASQVKQVEQQLTKEKETFKQLEKENRNLEEKVKQLAEEDKHTVVEATTSYTEHVKPETMGPVKMPLNSSHKESSTEESEVSITTVTSQDDEKNDNKSAKQRRKPEIAVEATEGIFEDVTRFSREPFYDNNGTSRFQTSVHPISLPPIQPPIVSEQLRQTLKHSTSPELKQRADIEHHRNKVRNRRQHSLKHKMDENVDEDTARVYAKSQKSLDKALNPPQPVIFNVPRKKYHKTQGNYDIGHPSKESDLELLMGEYTKPPGQFTCIDPQEKSSKDDSGPDTARSSGDETRRKIASLLEDAFSLISPSAPQSFLPKTASTPVARTMQPSDHEHFVMPKPHGRGSGLPRHRNVVNPSSPPPATEEPLFTRTQPPLVLTTQSGDRPVSYVAPASATTSGEPTYITPVKKMPGPKGGTVVWTPYRAFDEVSRLQTDLIDPSPPGLPNAASSPSSLRNITPPLTSSLLNHNKGAQIPSTSLPGEGVSEGELSDRSNNSRRSAARLMQGIKDEISKMTGRSTPVETLSEDSKESSPR